MTALERLREHLARADALVPLVVLGAATGAVTALVICAFRWLTEQGPVLLGVLPHPERFESLGVAGRIALPLCGALAIGLLLAQLPAWLRSTGLLHVMEGLALRAGRLPLGNALVQFVGAAIAVGSGLSVGREGPVVHVGAASSSLLGQWLGLPNNSLRVLVACGTAAGVGASFDTPLAGVVLAMEVVLMEYSIVGFTPVIVAAVVGTSVARAVYSPESELAFYGLRMASLLEIPYMLLLGACIGMLASGFIRWIAAIERGFASWTLVTRLGVAGLATAAFAGLAPQVMGIGYDTVELALLGQLGLGTLVLIAFAKLGATAFCIGLGVPGGVIGPTLVIGATAGGALGLLGTSLVPESSSTQGLYAMLGMGAMMGATLQAPLAALMAILELTGNPNIILPGMIAIVTANLTARVLFKTDSVLVTMLRARGLEYRYDPVDVALGRTGVGAVMERRVATLERRCTAAELAQAKRPGSPWILVAEENRIVGVLHASAGDVASHDEEPERELDLVAEQETVGEFATVRLQATLREALDAMERCDARVVLVTRTAVAMRNGVYGVLDRGSIEASVRYGPPLRGPG